MPGSILITPAVLGLVEGFLQVKALGAMPVRGLRDPVEVYEVTGAGVVRSRLQAAAARGLTRFVGRQPELETLQQALTQAHAGHGQVVALVGEAGVGKSRLLYEFGHSHHTQGWLVLESASVSYGKATPYFPVVDLLKRYCHVEERDDPRTIRAKVTGQILTLDEALQATIPALLALLDALPADSPFLTLDPPQRRQRTLDGLKRLLLRESQVQPLLLVFEDLHWMDTETQTLLDSLVESVPTAQLLLLVNYRPEYQHGWGSKTYYRQLRLDPLPPASADEFLQALLGDDPSLGLLKPLLIARTGAIRSFWRRACVPWWRRGCSSARRVPIGWPRLAHHAFRGEVWDKAYTYNQQAGAKAMEQSAYPAVVVSYEQALEALEHLPHERETFEQAIDLRLALRPALVALDDRERLFSHLHTAETLATALNDQRRLGLICSGLVGAFRGVGNSDRALTYSQRCLTLATTSGDMGLQIMSSHAPGPDILRPG